MPYLLLAAVVKRTAAATRNLTESERDLLSQMQEGNELETDSLGGNPVLRRAKTTNSFVLPMPTPAQLERCSNDV